MSAEPTYKPRGVYTALVTPFCKDDSSKVDFEALGKLIDVQIAHGVDGLVPMGTTGESPTMSHDEHDEIIAFTVKRAAGRVPIVAGTGSNCTKEAIRLTQHAKASGATATLQVNPYYNKPTQEGMYQHFKAIAEEGGLPVILYNIPGRSGVKLQPETVKRLYDDCYPNIVGIKEATGSLDCASEILTLCPNIAVLSGDDSLTLPLISIGGVGCVSVISNLDPNFAKQIVDPALNGDFKTAQKAHLKMFALCKGCLSMGVNPEAIKAAMYLMNDFMKSPAVRLPLSGVSAEQLKTLEGMLAKANVKEQLESFDN